MKARVSAGRVPFRELQVTTVFSPSPLEAPASLSIIGAREDQGNFLDSVALAPTLRTRLPHVRPLVLTLSPAGDPE